MIKIDKKGVKRILVIKLRGIGDVILSTIIIKNLLKEFPGSEIDYLTEKPSRMALANVKEINNFLLLERGSNIAKARLIMEIRKRNYDLVLDFFSNPTTALITFFSGARYRAGFPYRGRKYAYNLFGPEERQKYHSADLHTAMLANLGIDAGYKELLFGISEEEKNFALDFIKNNGLDGKYIIGLSPSGGWDSKKCPPAKFAELALAVKNKFDVAMIILWGPGDHSDAVKMKEFLPEDVLLAPPTTINQMAAFFSLCTAVIANDSGPMHISAAIGTPTIALFGPTDPALQGPYGEKNETIRLDSLFCINCNLTECPRNKECFNDITAGMMIEKFESAISKNKLNIPVKNG